MLRKDEKEVNMASEPPVQVFLPLGNLKQEVEEEDPSLLQEEPEGSAAIKEEVEEDEEELIDPSSFLEHHLSVSIG